MAKRYEEIEHTADVGIRAYGRTLEELFANAAEGMFSLIADLKKVRPVGEARVAATGADDQQLMVNWLQNLLFLHETRNLLFKEFDVRLRDHAIDATVRGEAIDPKRHELMLNVKAVTYHSMEIEPEKGYAVIIFDI